MTTADDPAIPTLLPAVPRPLTPRARWRSWNELSVRVWIVVTLAVVAASIYITGMRLHQAFDDRWLIEHGVPVNAKVLLGNGLPTEKRLPRYEPIPARIRFALEGQPPIELDIIVDAKANSYLQVGGELPIRVDPRNPQRWTEEVTPRSWSAELVIPGMLVPVIVLLATVTLLKRRKVLRVWTDGPITEGVVVEARQTAMAPGSRVVRFSLADENDPRIFSLLLPTKAGIPEPGQHIWLIAPVNNPKRAVAAGLYVSSTTDSPTT